MSISGSSGGGNIGSQQQPSINELEQTAANEALKLSGGLAITKDTIDLGFYELGGQIGRYPSNASRPVLPPLVKTRGSAGDTETSDNWKDALNALIEILPPNVQTEYLKQMALPLEQRSLNSMALNNVLTTTAVAMAWVHNASGPSTTEGLSSIDRALTESLSYTALDAMISNVGTVLTKSTDFLDSVGANYPEHDALRNFVRLTDKSLGEMEGLQADLAANKLTSDEFNKLAGQLTALSAQYSTAVTTNDLSMLGVTLAAMASLAAALSIVGTGNPTLYLALTLSSIGLEAGSSSAGFIGQSISGIASAATAGLAGLLLPDSNLAARNMLEMIMVVTFIGATAIATLSEGLGYIPSNTQTQREVDQQNEAAAIKASQNAADIAAAQKFSQELALTVLSYSGAVDATFSALVETFGLAPMQQRYLVESMKLLALTSMVLATAPSGNPHDAAYLFEGLQGTYTSSLTALSELVEEGLLDQSLSGETATSLSISLGQAKIALDGGNYADFIDALLSPLSLIGSSSEEFMADMGAIRGYVNSMAQSLTSGMDDQTNTNTRVSFIV